LGRPNIRGIGEDIRGGQTPATGEQGRGESWSSMGNAAGGNKDGLRLRIDEAKKNKEHLGLGLTIELWIELCLIFFYFLLKGSLLFLEFKKSFFYVFHWGLEEMSVHQKHF
jgi:hypothetical protein